jgi:hypothetical protein
LLLSWSAVTVYEGGLAVIDDDPTRADGGGDPLLGHLGRHPDVDVEPLTSRPALPARQISGSVSCGLIIAKPIRSQVSATPAGFAVPHRSRALLLASTASAG